MRDENEVLPSFFSFVILAGGWCKNSSRFCLKRIQDHCVFTRFSAKKLVGGSPFEPWDVCGNEVKMTTKQGDYKEIPHGCVIWAAWMTVNGVFPNSQLGTE